MKKTFKLSKLTINRETLRRLSMHELQPVQGGFTGPDSHCTSLVCPTKQHSICPC
ncbi:MAG TPA: class I lanthipeptide [Thermoanaerobaculia bacterium]|nr:class I lanthipeptide [Thermoanaerobaculia bacterium]